MCIVDVLTITNLTQLDAEQLASSLTLKEIEVLLLHGDMGQAERNKVITMFKKQEVNILVATDVAGTHDNTAQVQHLSKLSSPQKSHRLEIFLKKSLPLLKFPKRIPPAQKEPVLENSRPTFGISIFKCYKETPQ